LSPFFGDLEVEVIDLAVLDRRLKETSKQVNFFSGKSAPPDKILATPMAITTTIRTRSKEFFTGHLLYGMFRALILFTASDAPVNLLVK